MLTASRLCDWIRLTISPVSAEVAEVADVADVWETASCVE